MLLAVPPYLLASNPSAMWLNQQAFALMQAAANPILTGIMQALSESFYLVLPLVALYMYIRKDPNAYSLVVAAVVLFVIGFSMKLLVREPRPCAIPGEVTWLGSVTCESSFSFPSDHATVLTGLLFFMGGRKYTRVAYAIWLVPVLFGRVYLGMHYLTDVLAGIAISLSVAYVIYAQRRRINALAGRVVGAVMPKLALKSPE